MDIRIYELMHTGHSPSVCEEHGYRWRRWFWKIIN